MDIAGICSLIRILFIGIIIETSDFIGAVKHRDSGLGKHICVKHQILRQKGNERFIGIFNFSDSEKTAWMQEEGTFRDLITDQTLELKDVELPAYGFMWCKRM